MENSSWKQPNWKQEEGSSEQYSNIGGCWAKHPINKERRMQCEQAYSGSAKSMESQADLILAQAVAQKTSQNTGWTATQTMGVAVASLLAIGVMVFIIKKSSKK